MNLDNLGTVLHSVKQKYAAPNYVKTASYDELTPNTESANFYETLADPIKAQYPCHTKAATWVSAACFAEDCDSMSPGHRDFVGSRLEKYADFWGIRSDVESIVAKKHARIKQAAPVAESYPDDCYAVVQTINGKEVRQGLMRNREELEKAAEWLLENRDEMPLDMCTGIAQRILRKEAQLNASLESHRRLEQLTGRGALPSKDIAKGLRERARIVAPTYKAASVEIGKLADIFEKRPIKAGSPAMYKAANAIDLYDQHCGLTAMRKRGEIPYPEELCYGCTASDFHKYASDNVRLQTGDVYALSDLGKLDKADVASRCGDDLADACFDGLELNAESAADILPTLPRPEAEALTELLKESGISPVITEKAASAIRVPAECYS